MGSRATGGAVALSLAFLQPPQPPPPPVPYLQRLRPLGSQQRQPVPISLLLPRMVQIIVAIVVRLSASPQSADP